MSKTLYSYKYNTQLKLQTTDNLTKNKSKFRNGTLMLKCDYKSLALEKKHTKHDLTDGH